MFRYVYLNYSVDLNRGMLMNKTLLPINSTALECR